MITPSYRYHCNITKVYDGDTVTADIDLGFEVWLKGVRVRLKGINTPELRGDERPQGLESRDRLKDLLAITPITIESSGKGKYGRWIGTLWNGTGLNCNEALVEDGFAEYREY